MTKQVKCISPHGGGHHGIRTNGEAVYHLPVWGADDAGNPVLTGSYLPDVPPDKLAHPPNEGGYIHCPSLGRGHIAVGSVIDVPDDWEINEFHFEWVTAPPSPPTPPPAGSAGGE